MTDYSEQGATPVEDAVVENPPTVDEVLERQRRAADRDEESRNEGDGEDGDGAGT